jgi:SAM-dependent methyltransferase
VKSVGTLYYNWYVNGLLEEFVGRLCSRAAGDLVVDIGCGMQPYRCYLSGFSRYLGIDMPGKPDSGDEADIFADAQHLPLAAGVADAVLCTEVIEHVQRPARLLEGIFDVLKPGGQLILSVPFSWHIHDEPHDYWRFTEYGLKLILEDAGFTVQELHPVNGMVGSSLAGQCYVLLFGMGAVARPLIWLLQVLARAMRRLDRNHRTTSNYVVLARKPQ